MNERHTHRKQPKGYVLEEFADCCWEAKGEGISGKITFIGIEGICLSGKKEAHANTHPLCWFSTICQGVRNEALKNFILDAEGGFSLIVILLAINLMPEKPEYFRESLIEAYFDHPKSRLTRIQISNIYDDEWGAKYGEPSFFVFEKQLQHCFIRSLKKGSEGLVLLAETAKIIESKNRSLKQGGNPADLTKSDADFVRCVEQATEETEDIPTQKEVSKRWISQRKGRTQDQFKKIKKRLGFDWLPAGKRGENTH